MSDMNESEELRIVALGDSITLAASGNWPQECRWIRRVEAGLRALFPKQRPAVINAGAGGNTAREGWARFEEDVTPHRPHTVLIQFGGNDATPDPERHVGLDEFQKLMQRMVQRCRELEAQPMLLPFPPVIDYWHRCWLEDTFQEKGGQDRYIEDYRDIVRLTAATEGVPLIDIDRILRAACKRYGVASQIMPDGVHLTPDGNLTVALVATAELAQWMAQRCR